LLENRKYIGIEKNEDVLLHKVQPIDYVQVCNDRINEAAHRPNKKNIVIQHSFDSFANSIEEVNVL
jgi:hypothetical protein